jgi:hypothetical protein
VKRGNQRILLKGTRFPEEDKYFGVSDIGFRVSGVHIGAHG